MKSKQSVKLKLKLKVKPKVKVFLPQIRKRLVRQLLDLRLALLQDVFSNCHHQLLSGPALLLLGLALAFGPLLLQAGSPGGPALLEELARNLPA